MTRSGDSKGAACLSGESGLGSESRWGVGSLRLSWPRSGLNPEFPPVCLARRGRRVCVCQAVRVPVCYSAVWEFNARDRCCVGTVSVTMCVCVSGGGGGDSGGTDCCASLCVCGVVWCGVVWCGVVCSVQAKSTCREGTHVRGVPYAQLSPLLTALNFSIVQTCLNQLLPS